MATIAIAVTGDIEDIAGTAGIVAITAATIMTEGMMGLKSPAPLSEAY